MANSLYQETRRLLAANGFVFAGQRGSHQKWRNAAGLSVSLPVTIASRFTANAILKQAGIDKKF
jgi:predicted RNA binding protein YcfA (HicA-like mRNA interferase family)